jgi:lambda family phage portal protein
MFNFFKRTKESTVVIDKPVQKRSFTAASLNRLTNDFLQSDSILNDMSARVSLRARARELAKNNEFIKKYLQLIKNNVIGPSGITLSMQVTNVDGSSDKIVNDLIENLWWEWSQTGICDVTGKYSFKKVCDLLVDALMRDGEALIYIRRGKEFGKFTYQLQILDCEYLDDTYTSKEANGVIIRDGVEFNQFGKPIAYYILTSSPNDPLGNHVDRIRVPAQDIIHIFDPEYAAQHRGITKFAPVMMSLHHLSKFRESELIAARVAACKQAFLTKTGTNEFPADEEENGILTNEVSPGTIEILPEGYDIRFSDFNAPTTTFDMFNKAILRGVAVGLGVSYNSLNCDLESVNYSSARFGGIEEQNNYRTIQNFIIDNFVNRVFEDWLRTQFINNRLSYGINKFQKFNTKKWITKSFKSVDPAKDATANRLLLDSNLKTRTEILAESGQDFEETILQLSKEKELMDKYKLVDKDIEKLLLEAQNPPVV